MRGWMGRGLRLGNRGGLRVANWADADIGLEAHVQARGNVQRHSCQAQLLSGVLAESMLAAGERDDDATGAALHVSPSQRHPCASVRNPHPQVPNTCKS